jgi:hypothetical protein
MTPLIELLGKNVVSPEAARELGRYPALKREADDGAAGEEAEQIRYLRSPGDGLQVKLTEDGVILAIFLFGEGKEGFSQFRGELPAGLSFASTPADTLKTLGAPGHSRPPGKVGSFAHGDFLRFDRPGYSLHFQFRSDRRGLELVTAIVASAVPGRSVA